MDIQPLSLEWDSKELLEALLLIIEELGGSKLKRNRAKRKALKEYRRGRLTVDHLNQDRLYDLCRASLMLRHYNWTAWEWRSQWVAQLAVHDWIYPRWNGDRTKKLLVLAEQGIGDEIIFASTYHDLARDVDEAWIECDPRLINIFTRSFPDHLHFISRFTNDERRILPRLDDYETYHKDKGIEAFIMAGNVPKLYRRSRSDFPKVWTSTGIGGFLIPGEYQTTQWLETQPKVGCSWKGRQGEIPKLTEGISLQYGDVDHGTLTVPSIDLKWDLDAVFTLCASLDRVVTTINAVAHISGAVGTPTDVIKPPPIYGENEKGFNNRVTPWWPNDHCDWYPSVTMFRNWEEWSANQKR